MGNQDDLESAGLAQQVAELAARLGALEVDVARTAAGLSSRLRRLEDHQEILQTLNTYHHAIGSHDVARLEDVFTPEGVIRYFEPDGRVSQEVSGHAARAAWLVARNGKWPVGSEGHGYLNPLIRVDGDSATAEGFFYTMNSAGGVIEPRSFGEYRDRLVRCPDGRWRITLRELVKRLIRS